MLSIKVLIGILNKLHSDGLQQLFYTSQFFMITSITDDGKKIIKQFKKNKPDILLIDIELKNISGLNAYNKKPNRPNVLFLFSNEVFLPTKIRTTGYPIIYHGILN